MLDKSKVYVAFTTGHTFISNAIKWFTHSKLSHACLVHYSQEFQGWVALGAEAGGWIYTPIEENGVVDIYEVPVDLHQTLPAFRTQLGIGYDYAGVAGMTLVEAFWHLLKLKITNPLHNKHEWFCSAIVSKILETAGMKLGVDPASTDAQMLEDALVLQPGVIKRAAEFA